MTSQLIAIVLCTHGQRAVEQRSRIAAARGVSDTVSHWRTRTARNHMPAGPGCQRGLVFYGPVQGEKAMTTVITGIVGWPYHPPLWRCHSTDWGYRGSAESLDRASSHNFFVGWRKGLGRFDFGFGCGVGRHCEEFLHKASCIILSSVFFCGGGGWGGSTSGSASGLLGIANNFRAKPSRPFFIWREGGVGEVRLRVRLRVRWSLRATSAQILVHHPIKLFFLVEGGWGGSTSGQCPYKAQQTSSTLHCRGKNGRSKKIGQTNQKMIHFVPNMYVSGKISALRPGTQTVMIFGTTKKIRKLPKTTRFQDLRVFACFCGFLRAFCGFFAGFCGFYPQSFDALQTFFGLCLTKPKNMQSKS